MSGISPNPIYSVCIINYNSGPTIQSSLASILPQVSDARFEIVVVDNESTDHSREVLENLRDMGIVKVLVIRRSNRGEARHLAFEKSSAPYILANIDMDVIYRKEFDSVLEVYHRDFEGKVLSIYGMMIIPRSVAAQLGGWRGLDRHEDNDLALRAFESGLHAQDFDLNVVEEHIGERRSSYFRRLRQAYLNYRDWFRIGMSIRDLPEGAISLWHPSIFLAFLGYRLLPSYKIDSFGEWYKVWLSKSKFGANLEDGNHGTPHERAK